MKRWLRKREQYEQEEGILRPVAVLNEPCLRDSAVAILIITPKGIPLVRDFRKARSADGHPRPVYWKLPGGKARPYEEPLDAAIRESEEEVGAHLDRDSLHLIAIENKGSHDSLVYEVITRTIRLKACGDEGEEIRMFSPEELFGRPDFFPPHRRAIEIELFKHHKCLSLAM